MIKFNRVNYFKFVLSLCFIAFFIFVIANANQLGGEQKQLAIDSSFIQGDDGVSYGINLDNVNVNIDNNNNGVIEYTVQNGDTLLKIAGVFGTTVSSIQKDNAVKTDEDLIPGKIVKVSNHLGGIVYAIKEKTNVLVFANKYNLNLQDLMTLNYVQDQSELFTPGQEVFINITKDRAIELGLIEKEPPPEIISKSTIASRPTINKAGNVAPKTAQKVTTVVSTNDESIATSDNKSNIISKWTYTKKIKNGFAVGYCTWYAAIISPDIFPYIDETTQDRPFGGDAKYWCANAKAAGLRVGPTPAVGAVIVYSKLRSSAGHVGKVINYYPNDGKMIIRDMNYLGKFVVTERRENTDSKAISCYIYGK